MPQRGRTMLAEATLSPESALPPSLRASLDEEANQVLARIGDPRTKGEVLNVVRLTITKANESSPLLKVRFNEMVKDDPNRAELSKSIEVVRDAMDDMDTLKAGKLSIIQRVVSRNPLVTRLRNIARSYETGEQKINAVEGALQKGMAYLREDTKALSSLKENLRQQQRELAKKAYVGMQIVKGMAALPEPSGAEEDGAPVRDKKFETRLLRDSRDLGLIYMTYQQLVLSIESQEENNELQIDTVERLMGMVGTAARAAMAIQVSLLRSKQILAVSREVKEMLENLLSSNARLTREVGVEVAQAAYDPIISIEAVKRSHDELKAALQEVASVRRKAEDTARESLQSIDKVTSELQQISFAAEGGDAVRRE